MNVIEGFIREAKQYPPYLYSKGQFVAELSGTEGSDGRETTYRLGFSIDAAYDLKNLLDEFLS